MISIYLDSKDLISLAEKKSNEFSDEFKETLKKSSATLIYSMHNIMECSAPYVMGGLTSTVMKTLNFLENVPHKYIAEAKIPLLELREAISAYSDNRKYQPIEVPFVPRFDYTLSVLQAPPTASYIKYGLSQIIYELANEDKSLFEGYGVMAKKLKQTIKKDRCLSNYKDHKTNFSSYLTKNIKLYNFAFPGDKIEDLAEWIYQDINRCPGLRLIYEVYHKLLRNLGDSGEDSDIPDFAHISCAPYMNIITLDNRMRGYVEQVDKSIGSIYHLKVKKNLTEVRSLL